MTYPRRTVAVAATVLGLASGGGVAWACTDPGGGGPATGTTTTTTTTPTTTSTATSASLREQEVALQAQVAER